MAKPRLEVADVFRRHGESYRQRHGASLSCVQRRVMQAIESCRTAALGGHVDECDACGHRAISYNSCRNRHCPKCQNLAKALWREARNAEILPVDYYHVVFTLPERLASLALQNKTLVYDLLFRTAAETLRQIAEDPKHLGAHLGFVAVLHTWGQTLTHHPHVHCLVPGGGLSSDRQRWVPCKPGFFLPVRVLSKRFRRRFLDALERAFRNGPLEFHGTLEPLADPVAFRQLLRQARRQAWVVYAKPPFSGPETVVDYLARYTHRIAIANHRLLDLDDETVTFSYKDYRSGGAPKAMTLHAHEFIRRFLLHVLPPGFQRIRYYGFMANRHRVQNLELCRRLLTASEVLALLTIPGVDRAALVQTLLGPDPFPCPVCHQGHMVPVGAIPPNPPFHPRTSRPEHPP